MDFSSKLTWSIVCFEDENSVEAVPTSWIVGDNMCHFPTTTKEKVMAFIAKNENVNFDWPRYKVKTFRKGTYDDYSLARRKCKLAEDTSDLSSFSENEEGIKKRKRIQKVFSESSDSEEEIIKTTLPPPPKLTLRPTIEKHTSSVSKVVKAMQEQSDLEDITNPERGLKTMHGSQSQCEYNTPRSTPQTVLKRMSLSQSETDDTYCNTTQRNPLLTPHFNDYLDGEASINNSRAQCSHSCNKCCNQFEIICDSKLGDISTQCHLIRSIVTDVLKLAKTPKPKEPDSREEDQVSFFIKTGLRFPLEEIEDLNKFEEYLNSQSNFDSAVKELARVGGDTSYDFIKRNMAPLLSNALAEKYNWEGKKKKNKFKDLMVAKLILEADKKAKVSQTAKDCEKAIVAWLKRAKERIERTQKSF